LQKNNALVVWLKESAKRPRNVDDFVRVMKWIDHAELSW